jgi:hypothetical protein
MEASCRRTIPLAILAGKLDYWECLLLSQLREKFEEVEHTVESISN